MILIYSILFLGEIYDSTQSYTLPFILAGIPPILGATLMFVIRCVKNERNPTKEAKEAQPLQPMPQIAWSKGTDNHIYLLNMLNSKTNILYLQKK
jgi:hypothetical protein